MPRSIRKLILNYQSPHLFHRYPFLIHFQHFVVWIQTERLWAVSRVASRILKNMPDSARVIDFGCGIGEIIFPLAKRFRRMQFAGCDLNSEAIRVAKRFKKGKKGADIHFEQADLLEWNSDEGFDLIMTISVLQYISDPAAAVRKIESLMKPGGYWLIYLPVQYRRIIPGYRRLREVYLKDQVYDSIHRSNSLTENELGSLIIGNNLRIEEIHYVYGTAGKISYELLTIGQLMTLKLPWVFSIPFALIYFPIIILPAWFLMGVDLAVRHSNGNAVMMVVSKV